MSDFRNNLKKGVLWVAIEKYSGQFVSIVISMVLARLLTPAEYGTVATASIFIGFISIFTSIGIGPAIIQKKDLSQYDLNVIFTFTVIIGIVCGAITFASSWIMASFFNDPILVSVMQILAINVMLGAVNIVPAAQMSKHMRFREMATRGLVFQIIFGLLGIIAAYYGAGVYALIWPHIGSSLCTFLYNNHFYPVKMTLKITLSPIRKIFSFSSYLFLFETFSYFSRNTDKLIIGKFLSAAQLGYYEKSYRLMQLPLQNITAVVYPVLQPILSELQDNLKEIACKFTKIVKIIALIGFPVSIILHCCSSEIIMIMFGKQWGQAVPTFSIMALSIPFMLLNYPTGPVFLSCNASKEQFHTGVINTTITISGFIISILIWKNIESIAWSWTITQLINLINSYYRLYVKVMDINMMTVVRVCVKPIFCAILCAAVLFLYNSIHINLDLIPTLIVKGLIGVSVSIIFYITVGELHFSKLVRFRNGK